MRNNIPLEKKEVREYINSFLNYLTFCHGAIVEVIVRDWIEEKDKRLAWKEDKQVEKDIHS